MNKGQSTLEYVIILTVIIAAIIYGATQFLKPKVEDSMSHVSNEMGKGVERISFGSGTTTP